MNRREKIQDLKTRIKLEESAMTQLIADVDVKKEMELPEEERKQRQLDFKSNLAVKRANISSMKEELKLTYMNKYDSSFFEWHPHKGMNRRQAREFRKNRR